MSRNRRPGTYRKVELARAAWGAALVTKPRIVLEQVHGLRVDRTSLVVARVLGARHLAQAVLSGVRPSPEVLAMGVWVDVAHAASGVGLAVADRERARAGLTDAGIAMVWAAAGFRDLSTAVATPPAHDRIRDALARGVLRRVPAGGGLLRRAEAARARRRDLPGAVRDRVASLVR